MLIRDKLNEIKKVQRTVDELLEAGIMSKEDMHFQSADKGIDIDILYQKLATVGIGFCKGKTVMPEHTHDESRHYIICVDGRFVIKFCGAVRVLAPGDCIAIPAGVPHATQCIHEGHLIFVNVPAEKHWGEDGGIYERRTSRVT